MQRLYLLHFTTIHEQSPVGASLIQPDASALGVDKQKRAVIKIHGAFYFYSIDLNTCVNSLAVTNFIRWTFKNCTIA